MQPMETEQQLDLGRELGEQLDRYSLDRVLGVLIEWGIIEADLAKPIIDQWNQSAESAGV